jgi:CBS domain containing-hemolysin-like protein
MPDMVTIPQTYTLTQAIDVAIEHGFSRLPILNDDDDVVGITFIKDLIRQERNGHGSEIVTAHMRGVTVIPENKPVNRLMREMQREKYHLAVVADEHGSIVGIISLEDCLEELVGEIIDEFDDDEVGVIRLPNGNYRVDGKMPIDDVNELLATHLPNTDWDTLAGFVFNMVEHVPEPGESVEAEGWKFTVEELVGRRIRTIQISAHVQDISES